MTDCCLVYVTVPTKEEAQGIGRAVVTERLAACANLLGPIESYYHWEGKFEVGAEVLLLLKTTQAGVEALTARIRTLHSYSCPAIVALPILHGHRGFLEWVNAEVRPRQGE